MPKFQKGNKIAKGRAKGSPNKVTASIKQAITEAFDGMGGVASLLNWGKENQSEFYKLWGRLAPQEHEHGGPNGSDIVVRVVRD